MTTVSTKSGKVIKVVSREEDKNTLTVSDSEMDARAIEAVKAAILVDKMRYESIDKKEDFTFETVLSSKYKLDI